VIGMTLPAFSRFGMRFGVFLTDAKGKDDLAFDNGMWHCGIMAKGEF
jgi:hypothetical protein